MSLAAAGSLGCASTRLSPGTGDIAFRLLWSGAADLDLRVEDPEGHQLDFIARECGGGGILDIDCNAAPDQICDRPIENVYWPEGNAPEGVYRYRVVFFNPHRGVTEATYRLQVLLGDTVVEERNGHLTLVAKQTETFEYRFQRPP